MIISGEQLQNLAEISFCRERNCIIDSQKIKNNVQIIDSFNGPDLKKYKRVFIYSHDVKHFFEKLGSYLGDDVTIITHNSDIGFDASNIALLDQYPIKKWFCQNRYVSHPKLFSLPIGVANSQWKHGDQKALKDVIAEKLPKRFIVYKNFDISSNYHLRSNVNLITNFNGIPMGVSMSFFEYLKMVKQSVFVISPAGNGIDCHRIWECLALNTIPVVEYHECFSQFKHLPILFINNWNDVTPEFLKKQGDFVLSKYADTDYTTFKDPIKELDIEYWKTLICTE